MKITKNKKIKEALFSILIGACVAFMTSLFDALSELLKSHSKEIISGAATSATYLARNIK